MCLHEAAGSGKSRGQVSVGSRAWELGAPSKCAWIFRAWRTYLTSGLWVHKKYVPGRRAGSDRKCIR